MWPDHEPGTPHGATPTLIQTKRPVDVSLALWRRDTAA